MDEIHTEEPLAEWERDLLRGEPEPAPEPELTPEQEEAQLCRLLAKRAVAAAAALPREVVYRAIWIVGDVDLADPEYWAKRGSARLLDDVQKLTSIGEHRWAFALNEGECTRPNGAVDADEAFMQLIGVLPRTRWYAESRLEDACANAGILQRLLAAVQSAEARGGVSMKLRPLPQSGFDPDWGNDGAVWRRVLITVKSGGGAWSSRSYSFTFRALLFCEEQYDLPGIVADGVGRARVTSRMTDESTVFVGRSVANLAASVLGPLLLKEFVRGELSSDE